MSVRHLDSLFAPRSVAVVGVSASPGNLGAIVLRNLRAGGFAGPVWAVNRRATEVDGVPVLAGVDALPEAPELAVLCTPAATVPGLVEALGRKGTRAAIVLGAGMQAPVEPGGPTLEQAMLDAARPHLLRVLGPNCIGALVPGIGLNASFAPGQAQAGQLAFVTQSGALATAMLDWANAQGIGFSHFVSLGDSADVDFGDVLDYLASDSGTRAILLYVESVKHARKFMSAARAAARNKPLIVVKAGRAPEGARAAASHTRALAGSDAVFDAAVRRAGMVRVDTLGALFDAAQTLAHVRRWRGERLAIITNGGGAGVLAADALALGGGQLASLGEETLAKLDAVLPANWSHGNPVDIVGDAPVERYTQALSVLLQADEVDGVLFMHAPTAIVPAARIAEACVPLLRDAPRPVLSSWLGGSSVEEARAAFSAAGLASYTTPERAVDGWLQLVQYHRHQAALLQLPDAQARLPAVDARAAREVVRQALARGREWLDETEARQVLEAYGVPMVQTRRARDVEEAVAAASDIGYPVALKILSPQVLHKSDVGGVALHLGSGEEVRVAAVRMRQRVARLSPQASVTGFTVQAMAQRPRAHELIVGVAEDAVFGPVLLFGAGGTAVEVRKDRAVALPPLNEALVRDLVARTQVGPLLAGYRGEPGVDQGALVQAVLRVSQMACDLAELAELDINPLLADAQGVLALDARIRLRRPVAGEGSRLALRPYPSELEQPLVLGDRRLTLRPIRPEDGTRLQAFYAEATPADMRLRFFLARREVPRSELARYCQIDYEREMTFVALDGDRIAGEARAICDPDNEVAEFAVQVASDWQKRGLGRALLEKLLAYLRSRGTRAVKGECLQENGGMLALARSLGFTTRPTPEGTVSLQLPLRAG
ncbi:bifunctional acetate--CoA ligase family protein/GNAT family N-acetyltransferase [Ramlibacter sp. USB13]|uniref:Bifunctional acetate--CoA ligase family protein/GNAT family N-acetyltransferase n=1 Tax=Ramlibacter cellulosilyticus TaxID=2764187 RepID=A0A923MSP2_9BURK|nr:bifunctional acetate--CoA ligase family protein/GNAT family N-acetyltransferase [Ramlibacter cellulosilyticus]MBC5783469.1 bifunctional acetate--CoA ligase family protein/GNAT family N-acetyltransferase [Ramlibacter cellulosilyticus]